MFISSALWTNSMPIGFEALFEPYLTLLFGQFCPLDGLPFSRISTWVSSCLIVRLRVGNPVFVMVLSVCYTSWADRPWFSAMYLVVLGCQGLSIGFKALCSNTLGYSTRMHAIGPLLPPLCGILALKTFLHIYKWRYAAFMPLYGACMHNLCTTCRTICKPYGYCVSCTIGNAIGLLWRVGFIGWFWCCDFYFLSSPWLRFPTLVGGGARSTAAFSTANDRRSLCHL